MRLPEGSFLLARNCRVDEDFIKEGCQLFSFITSMIYFLCTKTL